MSSVDRARWRAWCGVADLLGLGPITFTPTSDGWRASVGRRRAEGATGVDALAALCRKTAVSR